MTAPDRFEVVEPERALGALAGHWSQLLRESAADTVFLTPEWMSAWWAAYARGRTSAVVLARRGGEIAGILPLQIAEERYRGTIPIRVLRFLGDGTHDSDYLDFIVPRGEEASVVPAFWAWLRGGAGPLRYDVARWNEIPAASPNGAMIRALAAESGALIEEERVGCVVTALPASWDGYVAGLKPRMRTKVRSLRRELETGRTVTLVPCGTEKALDATLESLFALHQRRWAARREPGVFGGPEKRAFYRALGRALLRRGWLDFHTLEVDGAPVAHQFCARYQGTSFLLQEGYDPAWEALGVGNVLRSMIVERLIAEGVGAYDFLAGVTDHKLSWGGTVKESARLTVRGSGPRAAIVAGITRVAAATAPLRAAFRRGSA
jgi:CelD/BcsL family acetyltransferase involved in cellulose biosynthesis